MSDDDERKALLETLDVLDLPPHALAKFFDHNRRFCDAHGGRRVYGELLALLDRCDAALAEKRGK
jgi:hypothetical protein